MTDETLLRLDKWLWYARFCKAALGRSASRIHLDGAIVQTPPSGAGGNADLPS
jgi:ribosomal 50S subunit-recycling heat shock protein